jgi:hypothetical protein
MKAMNRILLPASLTALTFFFAAPVAAFDTGFNGTETSLSEEICEDIGDSAGTTVDGWHEFNAIDYTEKQCTKVCKSVARTCNKAVKTNVECHKRMDKIQNDAWKTVCKVDADGDDAAKKECQSGVKDRYNGNKEEIKAAESIEREDCEEIQNFCLADCPGILFEGE